MRTDGRNLDQLRKIKITRNFTKYSMGSVLIESGETKVICTASVEEKVPPFLKGTDSGWISAEYSMLPSSTQVRKRRDSSKGKVDGRTQEIQRLIGRSLRSVVDMSKLKERTIWIDCDVIQADGGTRTASITGAFVALVEALYKLYKNGDIEEFPLKAFLGAISVGKVEDKFMLDLCYEEDSMAQIDMNIVVNDKFEFVEIQGTGEQTTFNRQHMNIMLDLAEKGAKEIFEIQKDCLKEILKEVDIKKEKVEMIVATSNPNKLEEFGKILRDFNGKVISMKAAGLCDIEIIEDGNTFEENAMKKAREIYKRTGKMTIADDSGLMVECLNGAPGIYSARFSGENATAAENNKKLLEMMKDNENRKAKFVTVIAFISSNGEEFIARGECPGSIIKEHLGDEGFGYDPLFMPDGYNQTFAQMGSENKNKISHRARALEKMKEILEKSCN